MTDRKIDYGVHDTPQAELEWLKFLKKLYDKNHFKKSDDLKDYNIPPIIHHVWLGSEIPGHI